VGLLIGHPDQVRELLLGKTEHDPPCAHARADMPVNILNAAAALARFSHDRGHGALHLSIGLCLAEAMGHDAEAQATLDSAFHRP
jgi:hypothetical protein